MHDGKQARSPIASACAFWIGHALCSLTALALATEAAWSADPPQTWYPQLKAPVPWLAEIRSISVVPMEVSLRGENRRQSLVVMATLKDGRKKDASHLARIAVGDPSVAAGESNRSLQPQAVVVAVGDGSSEITVTVGSQSARLPVRVAGFREYPPVHFVNDVIPRLSKLGCNSGGCHGRAAGQNGFKLSVFGFNPAADYDALSKEARGRRVFLGSPERSLLLTKPTAQSPHGGGARLAVNSPDYELLANWIRQGMPWGREDAPALVGLRVHPEERVLEFGDRQQILATALYSDGQLRDVTALAGYASNAEHVAEVDREGVVRTGQAPGEAAFTVTFMGQVAAVKVLVPRNGAPSEFPELPVQSPLDSLVWTKLKQMGILPSPAADDATYLRRAFLDTLGRVPTPDEVREFLKDERLDKRTRWIERILARDEYADLWAMKWADILLVDRQKLGERGAYELHRWLRRQFAANRPYDEWVRELITATGDSAKSGPANLYRSMDTTEGLARVVSQAFLGVRLECAQCHHHPFERWSQDDFYGLAGFFSGLERQPIGTNRVLVYHAGLRETRIPLIDRAVPTRVLDGPPLTAQSISGDPRMELAQWMTAPQNPWFARLAANRLWKHFFGRGLVEPEDDLRSTNPATNEPLLDYLAERLVSCHFDLKAVMREILNSHAYQLSSLSTDMNQDDEQNFSHYLARRLPAEVLLDAISDATGVSESYPGQPPGTRAVQLWDNRLPSYFLEIFGRPERTSPCECGRASEPTMAQALHLMNAPEIEARLADPSGRAAALAASDASNDQIVEELCLAAVGRMPTGREREIAAGLFAGAPRREAAADFLWTLLNSRDFLFNH